MYCARFFKSEPIINGRLSFSVRSIQNSHLNSSLYLRFFVKNCTENSINDLPETVSCFSMLLWNYLWTNYLCLVHENFCKTNLQYLHCSNI